VIQCCGAPRRAAGGRLPASRLRPSLEHDDSSVVQPIGLIDQLRLLNVARSAPEICADAGKTSCP